MFATGTLEPRIGANARQEVAEMQVGQLGAVGKPGD